MDNKGKKFTFALLGNDSVMLLKSKVSSSKINLKSYLDLKINVINVPFKSRLARAKSNDFDLLVKQDGTLVRYESCTKSI